MIDNLRELFTIEGKPGKDLEETKAAMEWFLSPAGREIGEKLLTDAYNVHKKPVVIKVVDNEETVHIPDKHTVVFNPSFVKAMVFKNSDGKSGAPSLEQILSHEIGHGGQNPQDLDVAKKAVTKAEDELLQKYNATLPKEKLIAYQSLFTLAITAKSYEQGKKIIERYVDNYVLKAHDAVAKDVTNHPASIDYVKKYEQPLLVVENKVAALTGGTVRDFYVESSDLSPEDLRKTMIDTYMEALEINSKPKEQKIPATYAPSKSTVARPQTQR